MKKILTVLLTTICLLSLSNTTFAKDKETDENLINANLIKLEQNIQIQEKIDDIGHKLLNANQIDVRMIFIYKENKPFLDLEPGLTKRQIFLYDETLQFADNNDEIAAYLARKICKSKESHDGVFKGFLSSVQIKIAPKKYEIFFDKRAIDFMVKAGYNPIGLITFLNKSEPQKRYDKFSRKNLTSKRLAKAYEYIFTKYPYYLKHNEYIENEAYQNFLLTSIENRKKLQEKIISGSTKAIKYE